MSEITNEVRLKIFLLYPNAKVKFDNELAWIICGYDLLWQKLYLNDEGFTDAIPNSYVSVDKCQIILKPLSSITDEDAIKFAKLGMYEGIKPEMVARDIIDRVINWHRYTHQRMCFSYEQADYLRSKSYMLPAYGITDLFKAGIAIDSTKILNETKN